MVLSAKDVLGSVEGGLSNAVLGRVVLMRSALLGVA